jgi:hypothetical protein
MLIKPYLGHTVLEVWVEVCCSGVDRVQLELLLDLTKYLFLDGHDLLQIRVYRLVDLAFDFGLDHIRLNDGVKMINQALVLKLDNLEGWRQECFKRLGSLIECRNRTILPNSIKLIASNLSALPCLKNTS